MPATFGSDEGKALVSAVQRLLEAVEESNRIAVATAEIHRRGYKTVAMASSHVSEGIWHDYEIRSAMDALTSLPPVESSA